MQRFVLLFLVVAVHSQQAQFVAEEDCDDDPARLRFAQLRGMIDEPMDLTPFIDNPVDYEVGRAQPMPPTSQSIVEVCPFGSKCETPTPVPTPVAPSPVVEVDDIPEPITQREVPPEPEHPKPQEEVKQEPEIVVEEQGQTKPKPPQQQAPSTPLPSPSSPPSRSPSPSPSPSPAAPQPAAPSLSDEPLTLAPREPNSQVVEKITQIKAEEEAKAIDNAIAAAFAASPSPVPPIMPNPRDETVVAKDIQKDVGLHFGPFDEGKPELPQHDPAPQMPPEPILESTSPSRTPSPSASPKSPSPSPYPPTSEDEFEPCDDPPTLPSLHQLLAANQNKDDIYAGDRLINAQRGQVIPLKRIGAGTRSLQPLHDFEKMPFRTAESDADLGNLFVLPMNTDDHSMDDTSKYQTFALQDHYDPMPGVHQAFRTMNLAGDDMGSFVPTLAKLDAIKDAASTLAGRILATETPLRYASDQEEEFKSNELASNVSWALMNDPALVHPVVPDFVVPDVVHVAPLNASLAPVHLPRVNISRAIAEKPQNSTHYYRISAMRGVVNDDSGNHTTISPSYSQSIPPSTPPPLSAMTDSENEPQFTHPNSPPSVPGSYIASTNQQPAAVAPPQDRDYSVAYDKASAVGGGRTGETGMNDGVTEEEVLSDDFVVPQVPIDSRDIYLGNIDAIRQYGSRGTHAPLGAMPSLSARLGAVSQDCEDKPDTSMAHGEEVAAMRPEKECAERESCSECLFESTSCVWCPAMNTCVPGGESGPLAAHTCVADFLFGSCALGGVSTATHTRVPHPQFVHEIK